MNSKAHLRGKHQSVANKVLERSFAIKGSRQYEQSIEPSSCLINSLGNEITRETLLELFLLLKRVVVLCIGHAATLEPAVKHFRDSSQHCSRYGQ